MTASGCPLREVPVATDPITAFFALLSTTTRSSWYQHQPPSSLNWMMSFEAIAAVGSVGHATGAPPPAPAVPTVLAPAVATVPAEPTEPALAPPALAPPLLAPATLVVPLLPAVELGPTGLLPAVLDAPAPPGAPPFPGGLLLELDEQADDAHNDNKSGRQRLVLFIDGILLEFSRHSGVFRGLVADDAGGCIVAALSPPEPAKLPVLPAQFALRDNHFMALDEMPLRPRGQSNGPRARGLF